MIPYPLRPVKKFPQKINLALPKPPKKQISLHRGEKSDVFSRGAGSATSNGRRWAPATKKPSKICGTRPGRWAARRVMVDGGRGGVAATKTRKNLRHAAGGRRVVPGGRGSIFFARTVGGAAWPQQKSRGPIARSPLKKRNIMKSDPFHPPLSGRAVSINFKSFTGFRSASQEVSSEKPSSVPCGSVKYNQASVRAKEGGQAAPLSPWQKNAFLKS